MCPRPDIAAQVFSSNTAWASSVKSPGNWERGTTRHEILEKPDWEVRAWITPWPIKPPSKSFDLSSQLQERSVTMVTYHDPTRKIVNGRLPYRSPKDWKYGENDDDCHERAAKKHPQIHITRRNIFVCLVEESMNRAFFIAFQPWCGRNWRSFLSWRCQRHCRRFDQCQYTFWSILGHDRCTSAVTILGTTNDQPSLFAESSEILVHNQSKFKPSISITENPSKFKRLGEQNAWEV